MTTEITISLWTFALMLFMGGGILTAGVLILLFQGIDDVKADYQDTDW